MAANEFNGETTTSRNLTLAALPQASYDKLSPQLLRIDLLCVLKPHVNFPLPFREPLRQVRGVGFGPALAS